MKRAAIPLMASVVLLIAIGSLFMVQLSNAVASQKRGELNQAYIRDIACIVSRPDDEVKANAINRCEKQVETELHVNIKNYLRNAY